MSHNDIELRCVLTRKKHRNNIWLKYQCFLHKQANQRMTKADTINELIHTRKRGKGKYINCIIKLYVCTKLNETVYGTCPCNEPFFYDIS